MKNKKNYLVAYVAFQKFYFVDTHWYDIPTDTDLE